ncbi:SGNH/GDSL hydrolase family protein [Motiliproteus sp. MSK22-1]|uniref:SGNH/GDSL hydrolase family protein n=1 Tax=Motiliproteus sp. MSK22-1 TaxID=1897630 RepID=UPI0009789C11|nr:SGNH/GDSL hydrolase family protein [Motiliproteus sp. MSK22-1]OMH25696.1 hypothetical protein BGP75_24465 [Motiliproteus sp. MSK22-1]
MPHPSKNKKRLFAITITVATTVTGWAISESFLSHYQKKINTDSAMTPGFLQYHSQFGWVLSKNWQGEHQHHDFKVNYKTNADGYRHIQTPDKSKISSTVALIGDSFTFGIGVNDPETFTSKLNQADSSREYINLGIPGYSTDQQYLLLKYRHSRLKADHYILMFYLGNDFLDNALSYPLQAEQAKPYFVLNSNNQLEPHNYPVPKAAKPAEEKTKSLSSIAYGNELPTRGVMQQLISSSVILPRIFGSPGLTDEQQEEAFNVLNSRLQQQKDLLKALFKNLKKDAVSKGYKFTVALLPGQSYVASPHSYAATFQEFVRKTVAEQAAVNNMDIIDMASRMSELKSAKALKGLLFHPNEGHLTTYGHQVVADSIQTYLSEG